MANVRASLILITAAVIAGNGAAAAGGYLRLDIRHPGVYRVHSNELLAAGIALETFDPEMLSLTCDGYPVPMLVKAGKDRRFDPEDYLEFVGDSTRGTFTWFRPDNKYNVYLLKWDGNGGPHYVEKAAEPAKSVARQHFWQWRHLEKNYQHWFSTLPPDQTDNFFWFPFFASNEPGQALQTNLVFPGFDDTLGLPVNLEARIFGATNAAGVTPSHRFTFLYNMKPVGEINFNGIALHDARFQIPPDQVRDEPARVSFYAPAERRQLVDKIYLDWINVRYPSRYDGGSLDFYQFNNDLLRNKTTTETLHVHNLPESATVYDPARLVAWQLPVGQTTIALPNADALTTYTAAAPFARMKVDRISLAEPAPQAAQLPADLQALVVYHPDVAQTAEAYTRYRREQGWKIQAVSVRAVFDQVSHGFIDDEALKLYLAEAKKRAPGLSHIVLLGDAYFDYREARSQGLDEQLDVLIPIHWVYRPGVAWAGGYQDDNWYGSFENPFHPDVAVGRLPINNDQEGMAYLRKVIEYETMRKSADDGGLMISSVEKSFQSYVKEVGEMVADKLSTATYLFPASESATREVASLAEGINRGAQLVYYVGHGGSMVWRVGPEDFSQQKDLFTPADVKQLSNRGRYPVVVCASCYTTAFDQPEGIGEAFVKQPGGGAIAVIGAPWKATVQDSHDFNRRLFQYYLDSMVKTIGEASLRAHRDHIPAEQSAPLENAFTLLGDPCLEIVRGEGVPMRAVGAAIGAAERASTSTVFRVEEGEVVLVGVDGVDAGGAGDAGDAGGSGGAGDTLAKAKVSLSTADFLEAKAYRGQVLLPEGDVTSREFRVPEDGTTITLVAAARAAADTFPRVRVSLVGERSYELYEGYWQTRVLESMSWGMPRSMRGQAARVRVEMLNPGVAEEERMFYLQGVVVE